MKTLRCFIVVSVTLLAATPGAGFPSMAASPNNDALMHESFQQFDQNLSDGWRKLQVQRDYLEAANTMLEYLSVHAATLKPWQKDSLAFHIGHVYALAGKNKQAISWFQKSMADHLMGNPVYTHSFIAFLENDKPALLADRHTIAATPPSVWRSADLHEMDFMVEYFGAPFEAAWGALNCVGTGAKADPHWAAFCRAVSDKYRDIYSRHFAAMRSR